MKMIKECLDNNISLSDEILNAADLTGYDEIEFNTLENAVVAMKTTMNAALLIIVCGTKPYELSNSMRLLKRLDTVDAYVLCPFTHETVRNDYAVILQSDFHKVLFLDYQPEPTDGMSNSKQYKTMMTKYIAGV